jgi:hypothetical protein
MRAGAERRACRRGEVCLVHICITPKQDAGQPLHCACSRRTRRLHRDQVAQLVAAGKAQWKKSRRNDALITIHSEAVLAVQADVIKARSYNGPVLARTISATDIETAYVDQVIDPDHLTYEQERIEYFQQGGRAMKAPEEYSGEQVRCWRHRLGVPLLTVARIGGVSSTTLSYLERNATGVEAAKAKIVLALADIETVLEQRRPINLDPRVIECAVAELRRTRSSRTKRHAAASSSVKTVRQSAAAG